METSASVHTKLVSGHDPRRALDALFVNAPLRDYTARPRVNDFTLPVLGMGYIATHAARDGYNVGVLDAEARGLPVEDTIAAVNQLAPRWVGFNLLAPTYEISAHIAAAVNPGIKVMVGGHQAKATPIEILTDPGMSGCQALVLGEGETRVSALLDDHRRRADLPGVMWIDPVLGAPVSGGRPGSSGHLAPDINELPFVDRAYLAQDPHHERGRLEANMVGARGCPYDCSFCGAAVSANPDITIRTRPALAAGQVVVCDRYIASSLVLQRLDGVDLNFLKDLNAHADRPDLAAILIADPRVLTDRVSARGSHGRFEDNPEHPRNELSLYQQAAALLSADGVTVTTLDTSSDTPEDLAMTLTRKITALSSPT